MTFQPVIAPTPNVQRVADISAVGPTTIWTPAAGKRFVLMRYVITLDGGAILGAAGAEIVTLNDAATPIFHAQIRLPAAANNALNLSYFPVDVGQYVSLAANNVLTVTLGTVLAAGLITVTAIGIEQ